MESRLRVRSNSGIHAPNIAVIADRLLDGRRGDADMVEVAEFHFLKLANLSRPIETASKMLSANC